LQVTEVLAVEDLQVGAGNVAFTTTSLFVRSRFGDALKWTGNLPVRAARTLELGGYDVRSLASGETGR
jgi:hypothetical protein